MLGERTPTSVNTVSSITESVGHSSNDKEGESILLISDPVLPVLLSDQQGKGEHQLPACGISTFTGSVGHLSNDEGGCILLISGHVLAAYRRLGDRVHTIAGRLPVASVWTSKVMRTFNFGPFR